MRLTGDEVARAATDENGEERTWEETAAALQELVDKQLDSVRKARDAEWNRAIGYNVSSLVLAPAEAAGWLEKDRVTRARNVSDARQRRGPIHW